MKTKYSKEVLEPVVKNSKSYADVCRGLGISTKGGNYYTVRNAIESHSLDISHFQTREQQLLELKFRNKIPLEDILVVNSSYSNNFHLKNRLVKESLLEENCYVCGIGTMWNNLPLVLQLDHINGINNDNRLNNLRMICPNCHSQTETFCGKHTKEKVKKIKIDL